MRCAFFSDIHGNLEALETVLSDIDAQHPDQRICLGDIVGYGASPNECVERVRGLGIEVLCGNHDHAALGRLDIEFFNENARVAMEWTRGVLTPENLAWLESRPYVSRHAGFLAVHASPGEPAAWDYVLSVKDAAEQFLAFTEPLAFIGHSHFPTIFREAGGLISELDFPPNRPFVLESGVRCIVNVGSVGQPRDSDPRASWALYDSESGVLELRRLDYPVARSAEKIVAAGLPAFLAARLEVGM